MIEISPAKKRMFMNHGTSSAMRGLNVVFLQGWHRTEETISVVKKLLNVVFNVQFFFQFTSN